MADVDGLEVDRHNKKGDKIGVSCTPTVVEYNMYMGAVDLNDI